MTEEKDATVPTPEQMAKRRREVTGAETAPVYYANYLGITATKGDMCLRFGQIDVADTEKLAGRIVANIYVSPDHLIDFMQLLHKKIADYTRLFPNSTWANLVDVEEANKTE